MLHDGGQRHRKRPRQLADRYRVVVAQPRQQGPARRIGQRREGAIQRLRLILNHMVKYRVPDACCQVTQFRLALLSFRGAPQGANPKSSKPALATTGFRARRFAAPRNDSGGCGTPRNDSAEILHRPHTSLSFLATLSVVIPGPERSEGTRNPVTTAGDYWIPGSPLRGASE
jgi:hypothetical protein